MCPWKNLKNTVGNPIDAWSFISVKRYENFGNFARRSLYKVSVCWDCWRFLCEIPKILRESEMESSALLETRQRYWSAEIISVKGRGRLWSEGVSEVAYCGDLMTFQQRLRFDSASAMYFWQALVLFCLKRYVKFTLEFFEMEAWWAATLSILFGVEIAC